MANRNASVLRNGTLTLLIVLVVLVAGVFQGDLLRSDSASIVTESEPALPADLETEHPPFTETAAHSDSTPVAFTVSGDRPPIAESGFESPFVGVAERLKPSVVNITVRRESGAISRFDDLFQPRGQEPRPRRTTSGGSGFIVDRQGYVLTNNHVIDQAVSIQVSLFDGSERDARLVGTDPETDIALLEIGQVDPDWVAMLGDSDSIRMGEWAIAMGNPMGLDWTLTVGVISATGRSDLRIVGGGPVFQDFIQTDASINFGNSGGPLANIRGEVIGVNSAVNTSAQGIGFAIPINMAREVVTDLVQTGYVRRGYLGMMPVELDALKKEALGLDGEVKGVFVESVSPATPAEAGGLLASDVITDVDGSPVDDVSGFRMLVARHRPGEEMRLNVIRAGHSHELGFTLADRSDYVATAGAGVNGVLPAWMGLRVGSLTGPMARQFPVKVEEGVLVLELEQESPAEGKLQVGDVIARVDGIPITGLSDWQRITAELGDTGRAVLVMYYRGGQGSQSVVALKR